MTVRVSDHVGHRWAKDVTGIYCRCQMPKEKVRLYAHGSVWNSPTKQAELARALDYIRTEVGLL